MNNRKFEPKYDTDLIQKWYFDSTISTMTDNIYSTNETVIGKWIDGRNVYQKVINLGSYSWTNGSHSFEHHIDNFDIMLSVDWIGKYTNERWYTSWDNLTALNITSNINNIIIYCNSNGTLFTDNYLILKYIKK